MELETSYYNLILNEHKTFRFTDAWTGNKGFVLFQIQLGYAAVTYF